MNPIRVVIVDDEAVAIEVIQELIAQLTTDVAVAGTARNGYDAIEKITMLKPDLVFMDLDMPLMNGYEVVEKLTFRSFYLVFTTGYTMQEIKKTNGMPTSFLSKPIDPAEFVYTIEHARRHLSRHS